MKGELRFDPQPHRYPGRHEVVDAELLVDGQVLPVVVKKIRRSLSERIGKSRAQQAFEIAVALWERDLPTPKPLGVLERPGESWYVCAKVAGARQIREWFLHRDDPRNPEPLLPIEFEEVVRRVARLGRALHDGGVWFRDFTDGNILVTPDSLWLVDLSRARLRSGPVGLFPRLRDLSRLGLNRSEDRNLLLSSYFHPEPVPGSALLLTTALRSRIVAWDDLKKRLRPWKRYASMPGG